MYVQAGCVYKLVRPLAVAVMYGVLEEMAGPSVPPHPTSASLLRGNERAVAWNRVADQTVSLKKHSTRPLVCVCVWLFGKRGWKRACNTLQTTPTLWPLKTHTHTYIRRLMPERTRVRQPPKRAHAKYRLNTDRLALISPFTWSQSPPLTTAFEASVDIWIGCHGMLNFLWGPWLAKTSD